MKQYKTPRPRPSVATKNESLTSGLALLKDGVALALITVLLYVAAGAYSFGYQDQFGFTYLSLGLEDLVITSRAFVLQFVLATVGVALIWALLKITWPSFRLTLAEMMLPGLPLALAIAFASISSVRWSDLSQFDAMTFVVLTAYYLVELMYWSSRWWPRFMNRLADASGPLRFVQAIAGAALLLLLAFDLGVVDAVKAKNYSFCPDHDGAQWVALQMTGDLVVCAETDVAKGYVYRRFSYLKVADAPGTLILNNRPFTPVCIGLPKDKKDRSREDIDACPE